MLHTHKSPPATRRGSTTSAQYHRYVLIMYRHHNQCGAATHRAVSPRSENYRYRLIKFGRFLFFRLRHGSWGRETKRPCRALHVPTKLSDASDTQKDTKNLIHLHSVQSENNCFSPFSQLILSKLFNVL